MTLMELQEVFGEQISVIRQDGRTPEEQQMVNEKAKILTDIGKQMINNADLILRYEKLEAQTGALKATRMRTLIGD